MNSPPVSLLVQDPRRRQRFFGSAHQRYLSLTQTHAHLRVSQGSYGALLDGALNLLFRRFKVVEGRSKAVAECLPALPAANDKDGLTAPQRVAAVIG